MEREIAALVRAGVSRIQVEGCIPVVNLDSEEVDRLAAEVAALTNESKTEAVRRALLERKARLTSSPGYQKRSQRAASVLAAFRADLPQELLGKPLSRREEDDVLGFGPGGV